MATNIIITEQIKSLQKKYGVSLKKDMQKKGMLKALILDKVHGNVITVSSPREQVDSYGYMYGVFTPGKIIWTDLLPVDVKDGNTRQRALNIAEDLASMIGQYSTKQTSAALNVVNQLTLFN